MLGVFFFSGLAIMVVALLFPIIGPTIEIQSLVMGRVIGLLLTLAATSLIVLLIVHLKNPIIGAIGFLVIGALVVPTGDMVRFWLVVTGSEQSIDDLYADSAPIISKVRPTAEATTSKVMAVVAADATSLDPEAISALRDSVKNVIENDRYREIGRTITRHGASPLFCELYRRERDAPLIDSTISCSPTATRKVSWRNSVI